MAIHKTTTSELSPTMVVAYQRMLLMAAEPNLIHAALSERSTMVRNNGKVAEWHGFSALPTKTLGLTEGVAPTEDDLEMITVQATIQQEGGVMKHSDFLQMTALDPIIMESMRLQGDQAGRTLDLRACDSMHVGTVVQYVGSRTARNQITASDIITSTDIKKVARTLENKSIRPFPQLGNRYAWFIHPDVKFDLTEDAKWKDPVEANTVDPEGRLANYAIGPMYKFMFFMSPLAKVFTGAGSGGADVYSNIAFGQGFHGIKDLQGITPIVKQLGSAGTNDPADQVSSTAWKAAQAQTILQDAHGVRYECGASQ